MTHTLKTWPEYLKEVQKSRMIEIKPSKLKSYAVTGTFHGSIVDARSEGEARRIFHKHYKGESIINVRKQGDLPPSVLWE
jgi:hypothetical protein